MILDAGRAVAGYPFIARRYGRVALCDPGAASECFERARELAAGVEANEPAALFYALASRRRAFPFAWKLMAWYLATAQATTNGLAVDATREELDALCVEVLYQRATWPVVLAWFAVRQHPAPTTP